MTDKPPFKALNQEEVDAVVGAGRSVNEPIEDHTPGPWRASHFTISTYPYEGWDIYSANREPLFVSEP